MRVLLSARSTIQRRFLSSTSLWRVPLLLSPKELKELPKGTTLPLDVSWHMPNSDRSPLAEYLSGPRIPDARRFDLDEVADLEVKTNPLSLTHMLPTKEVFEKACQQIGITNETHVVLYDTVGVFSSPRGAYTFKAFGHDKVSVLDGGLPRWIEEGFETEMGELPDNGGSEYVAAKDKDPELVRTYEEIVENSQKSLHTPEAEVVLDLRPLGRYTGETPEPRHGLSSGHIPNSLATPFASYLTQPSGETNTNSSYKVFKSPEELKAVLQEGVGGADSWKEIQDGKGLVFSCGSGMTAAVGWFANELLKEKGQGAKQASIYDESWTGYASRKESKVVKGKPGSS